MTDSTNAAWIGVLGSVLGASIPLTVSAILKHRGTVKSPRSPALIGQWTGTATDVILSGSRAGGMEFYMSVEFWRSGRIIKGKASLYSAPGGSILDELLLQGSFYNDDYLQLTYANALMLRKQLGVAIIELLPIGTELVGHYIGYSPRRDAIVNGNFRLNKSSQFT